MHCGCARFVWIGEFSAGLHHRRGRPVEAIDVHSAVGLTGGRFPRERLAIHLRHYETTLVPVIIRKFPGIEWLVVTPYRDRPRLTAEYGWDVPDYLATCPGSGRVPYLRDFAELEVRVGLCLGGKTPAAIVAALTPRSPSYLAFQICSSRA